MTRHEYKEAEEYHSLTIDWEKMATVRYEDERIVLPGDSIAISHPETVGVVAERRVRMSATMPVVDVMAFFDMFGVRYPIGSTAELISTLNSHYEETIDHQSSVHVIVYRKPREAEVSDRQKIERFRATRRRYGPGGYP